MSFKVRMGLGTLLVPIFLLVLPGILSAQSGTITGRAVQDQSGAPIPAVQVSIPALKMRALTAGDGSCTLAGLRPGKYELHVIRVRFKAADVPVQVTAGPTA